MKDGFIGVEFNLPKKNTMVSYGLFTSFWALCAGATLAYFHLHKPFGKLKNNLSRTLGRVYTMLIQKTRFSSYDLIALFSISLIGIGFLLITKKRFFPGFLAILPILGTVRILVAPKSWVNLIVLSNPLLTWIGLTRFFLYLWNWPLLFFWHLEEGEIPSRWACLGVVLISILLAWMTQYLIERPVRFGKTNRNSWTAPILCFLIEHKFIITGDRHHLTSYLVSKFPKF